MSEATHLERCFIKTINGEHYYPYGVDLNGNQLYVKRGEGYSAENRKWYYDVFIKGNQPQYRIYHSGGFVGGSTELASNEEFAKLLKGEFVSTPSQMKKFMENTLPRVANYTASEGGSNEFNAPLVSIICESVTSESLPGLKKIVNEAVEEVKRQLDSGMSRTGYKRQTKSF